MCVGESGPKATTGPKLTGMEPTIILFAEFRVSIGIKVYVFGMGPHSP